jgi:hypothetical protein
MPMKYAVEIGVWWDGRVTPETTLLLLTHIDPFDYVAELNEHCNEQENYYYFVDRYEVLENDEDSSL